jgi:hypothetical protein
MIATSGSVEIRRDERAWALAPHGLFALFLATTPLINMKQISTLHDLQGEDLSDVTFVMDYLQLGFSGSTITIYSRPIAELLGSRCRFPASGSRDALCSFIGHTVRRIVIDGGERIVLEFDNGTIQIPLDAASRVNGDAVEFWAKKGSPPLDF